MMIRVPTFEKSLKNRSECFGAAGPPASAHGESDSENERVQKEI